MKLALAAVSFYLLGSIPFSFLIARLFKGIDIRQYGSGNVGATNVTRVIGRLPGALALILDMGKGALVAFLAQLYAVPIVLAGLAVIGHNWSVFLRFTGGKGVATSLGILLIISWPAFLITLGVWLVVLVLTRHVSVGSMTALMLSPLALFPFNSHPQALGLMLALGILTVFRHRENIARLRRGKESKAF